MHGIHLFYSNTCANMINWLCMWLKKSFLLTNHINYYNTKSLVNEFVEVFFKIKQQIICIIQNIFLLVVITTNYEFSL
jgi:uncharacterized protein VirK/YbjX